MGASREDDALARRMGKISEKSVNVVVVERPEAREALARTCLRAMLRERGAFDRVATFEDGTCARVERDDARDAFSLRETLLDGVCQATTRRCAVAASKSKNSWKPGEPVP